MEPIELADFLQSYMDEAFNTECEDGSPRQAAREMCRVFSDISRGDFTSAESKIRRAAAAKLRPAGRAAHDQADEADGGPHMDAAESRRRRAMYAAATAAGGGA